jgi:hypothetical protein
MVFTLLYLVLYGLEEQVLQGDFQLRRPVQEGGVLGFGELDSVGSVDRITSSLFLGGQANLSAEQV